MDGPKQESNTRSTSINRPLAEAMPLVNSTLGTIGNTFNSIFGVTPAAASTLPGGPGSGGDFIAPAGKRLPPGYGGGGGGGWNVGLTGTESDALDALGANAAKGNPYAPQFGLLANDLLAGGTDRTGMVDKAYDQFRTGLLPYTTMSTDPRSNPDYARFESDLTNKVNERLDSSYAGAGFSPERVGSYGQDLGRAIAGELAPHWMQAKNDLEARKFAALNATYGAGTQAAGLLHGFDQDSFANRFQGINAAGAALSAQDEPLRRALTIEAEKRAIPFRNIAQAESLIVPMAGLGSQQTGNSNTTTQTHVPPLQAALGAGLLGASIFGGPAGLLGPAASAATGAAAAPLNLASFRLPAWGGSWGDPTRPGSIY